MTETSKVSFTQALVENDPEATGAFVTALLSKASSAVLRRLYPFGVPDGAIVPEEYASLQCELAARYFNRRGGEGEIGHSENGISRSYGSVNDEDLLSEIVPYAKVM